MTDFCIYTTAFSTVMRWECTELAPSTPESALSLAKLPSQHVFWRLLWRRRAKDWFYQAQSAVSVNAWAVRRRWLSAPEIRDDGLKDKTPAPAPRSVSAKCIYVGGCVSAGGCLYVCVNEEVISGVNAWQRAKGWPPQGGNRGEDYKNEEGAEEEEIR